MRFEYTTWHSSIFGPAYWVFIINYKYTHLYLVFTFNICSIDWNIFVHKVHGRTNFANEILHKSYILSWSIQHLHGAQPSFFILYSDIYVLIEKYKYAQQTLVLTFYGLVWLKDYWSESTWRKISHKVKKLLAVGKIAICLNLYKQSQNTSGNSPHQTHKHTPLLTHA